MKKVNLSKMFRPIIALLLITSMVLGSIATSHAASSSDVVRNAQAIFDDITANYGSIKGYIQVLNANEYYYQKTLNDAEFYNYSYNLIRNYGSTLMNVLVSVVSGNPNVAIETVKNEAIDLIINNINDQASSLNVDQYIYAQAKTGSKQVSLSDLMEIGFSIEDNHNGRIESLSDAKTFITAYQNIQMGFAAYRLGHDYYCAQLQRSSWDMLFDISKDAGLSYLGKALTQNKSKFLKNNAQNITQGIYELIDFIAAQINNKYLSEYTNTIKSIAKETERLLSYDIDDYEKNSNNAKQNTPSASLSSKNTSTASSSASKTFQPAQNKASTVETVSIHYHASDYNEGQYEGQWSNGKPNGYGKLTYDDFSDGKYYALGFSDGSQIKALYYEGYFKDGYRQGNGTVVYEGGYKDEGTFYGIWSAGKIVFEGKRWIGDDKYYPLTTTAVSGVSAKDSYGSVVYVKKEEKLETSSNNIQSQDEGTKESIGVETESTEQKHGYIYIYLNYPELWNSYKWVKIDSEKSYPISHNQHILAPIRTIIEEMGGTITWNSKSKCIKCNVLGNDVILCADSRMYLVNGIPYFFETAPMVINSKNMFPVGELFRSIGCTVSWDSYADNWNGRVTIQY